MRMLSPVAVLVGTALSLGACATASPFNSNDGTGDDDTDDDDGSITFPDARTPVDARPGIDAPDIDAAPSGSTLSQTNATIGAGLGRACTIDDTYTGENSWWRVFDLTTMGVTGDFNVSSISFAVEVSDATKQIGVAFGTLNGTAGTTISGSLTGIASTTASVGVVSNQMVMVPISGVVPAGSKLVVEILAPTGETDNSNFVLGASSGTETSPGYIQSADCGFVPPESIRSIDAAAGAAIITITGN